MLLKQITIITSLLVLLVPLVIANGVKSTTGQIKFDTSFDGISEMELNETGLGVGPNLSPQAKLHVSGNASISDQITIGDGDNSSQSSFHLNGTISFMPQMVASGNHIVDSTIVLADTSSGNVTLSLPDLADSVGMKLLIKRTHLDNELYIATSGSNVEGVTTFSLGAGNFQTLELFNSGSSWLILNNSETTTITEVGSSSLFLWWGLDETSGNIISDLSSNSRSGNLTNGHLFSGNSVSGPTSKALLLNSGNVSALYDDGSLPTGAYTYALWSQYNFNSDAVLEYEPYIDGAAGFVWASGNSMFHKSAYHQLSDDSYVTTSVSSELLADTWYHIAVSWSGSDLSLYLNGEYQSGNTAASWSGASNIMLTNPGIQSSGQSRADDLRFYSKALTSDEIQALYLAGQP